ncbi:MAG TPA: hypothetical protein DCW41_04790 [Clostridiales bacterium]|nr:hypothetical protein [Clostridiales bacterium]
MNLGTREKYGIIVVVVLIGLLLLYMFGIRGSESKNVELNDQKAQLEQQLQYYNDLKDENAATRTEIANVEANISAEESKFIPNIKTESIEQYVLKVFEDNGCPFLVAVSSDDIEADKVQMPDGTVAQDTLLIKRITVKYSTTDGFNVPQYNLTNSSIDNGVVDEDIFQENIESMFWKGTQAITGYEQFVESLRQIEAIAPDSVKISRISTESMGGFLYMEADIDFFSASFIDRVSEPDTSAPYTHWTGDTGVATDGGFIGYPFIVDDANSLWLNVLMADEDAGTTERPFATYYSAAIFSELVEQNGLPAVLELDADSLPTAGGGADGENGETPADGEGTTETEAVAN